MDRFVSLHRHDSFSTFDGLDLPVRAAERAMRLEQPAVGVTNHGNVAGLVDHYRVCTDRGVKPVLGVEAYLVDSLKVEETVEVKKDAKTGEETEVKHSVKPKFYHQTLLVETEEGYRNLMRLVTRANKNFYYKPRLTLEDLEEYAEGIVVLSGCPSSMVQRAIADGDEKKAWSVMGRLRAAFPGSLYIEVQHHESSVPALNTLLDMAMEMKLPLVATNDAHYVDPEDRPLHDWMLASKKKGKGEDDPSGYGYGFHMTTRKEMEGLLKARHGGSLYDVIVHEALENTMEIAERCGSFKLPRSSRMFPQMWGDQAESSAKLKRRAVEGLRSLGLHRKREYAERLKRELEVIEGLGYIDYFNAVSEVTDWARGEGILIGPRGSVCGSLLAYVLGITLVDPLVHGTMFERFLHEQKKAMPDVDLDIDARYHDRVIEWVLKRHEGHAYKIITYGRFGAGNIPMELKGMFLEESPTTWKRLKHDLKRMKDEGRVVIATEDDVREWCDDVERLEEKVPWVARGIAKLYFMVKYVGRHPGGVCFTGDEPTDYFSLVRGKDHQLTSYTYLDLEYLGLLKLDFLGLKAMTAISTVVSETDDRSTTDVLRGIPMDDEECYRKFASGDTAGMFQFETPGGTSILTKIRPENFRELTASTALNRPGVSANLQRYIDGKKRGGYSGQAKEGSLVAEIRDILEPTYGAVVYQEQIVRILRAGGLEWQECDTFLKGIKSTVQLYSWSFDTAKSKVILDKFVSGLVSRGFDEERARKFVERIAQYSFNMSHATAYSMVAYWQMWLRVHRPLEFWCAMLTHEHDQETRWYYEQQAIRDGIVLLPPHVNGTMMYSVEDGAIRVGLTTIFGVGEKAAAVLENGRPYAKASDILKHEKRLVNARVKKALLGANALVMDKRGFVEWARSYNNERLKTKTWASRVFAMLPRSEG